MVKLMLTRTALVLLLIVFVAPWYTAAAQSPAVTHPQSAETPDADGQASPTAVLTATWQGGGQTSGSSRSGSSPPSSAVASPTVPLAPQSPTFGPIVFCDNVAANGAPINPREHFPAGTTAVTVRFTYDGAWDGMSWGQLWMRDGQVATSALTEVWDEGLSGWAAYIYEEDDGAPLSGKYDLTLFIQGTPVQHATFYVDAPSDAAPASSARLGPIVFCQDVSDAGEPINPTDYFPEGAKAVWAYFTYENMEPGQRWGRYWQLNGEEYINATGQSWEDGRFGWTSYAIEDANGLPAGEYTLTLYIGDQPVQEASVRLGEYSSPRQGHFGEITFAAGMTEDREPVSPSRRFDFGVDRVYAIFPYYDMCSDQVWAADWTANGEPTSDTGDVTWGEGPAEGVTYLFLEAPEGQVLAAGDYRLNLYLDAELVRSASFAVNDPPTPVPPARPEDIMDADLLPAWYRLASCPHPTIQELAQVTLKYHIPIRFGDVGQANATYRYNGEACNSDPGEVYVSRTAWNELSWEEVASKIGHELWHATQLLEGGYSCDCTVQKEVEAKVVELYVLRCLGRDDILVDKWGGAWDWDNSGHGKFDQGKLWRALEEAYSHCAKYEP